jgi:hypothetical protein
VRGIPTVFYGDILFSLSGGKPEIPIAFGEGINQ